MKQFLKRLVMSIKKGPDQKTWNQVFKKCYSFYVFRSIVEIQPDQLDVPSMLHLRSRKMSKGSVVHGQQIWFEQEKGARVTLVDHGISTPWHPWIPIW
jgi:hypothetical protein